MVSYVNSIKSLYRKNLPEKFLSVLRERYPRIHSILMRSVEANTCPFCGERFSSRWSVAKHMVSKHYKEIERLAEMIREREDEETIIRELFRVR
ncbi:MAG: hypothetical protein C0179_00840 [Fervidicoccus sp.]|jgi:hypothetical protein|nr:MAG: hypothetical protein C0179_00840 [Fervidicoccus sp.]